MESKVTRGDWVPSEVLTINGQEGSVSFGLGEGPTGDLVSSEVTIELGPLHGTAATELDLDPKAFSRELKALLERPDLSGDINVASGFEAEFRAVLTLHKGKGTLHVEITTGFALQDGKATVILTTDQSFLRRTLHELEALLSRYHG